MNIVSRGIQNAFRNGIRTFSIVVILGLIIGVVLSMLVARQAVNDKITSVKSSIGNTIAVSPAGAHGFEGGGNPLTIDQVNGLKGVANVTNVTATLGDRLTSDTTSLQSAIDAGSLGQRFSNNNGVQFQAPTERFGGSGDMGTRSFTPPVRITGINDLSSNSVYGGSSVKYVSGQAFDPTKDDNVAVIGASLASKNNLSVDSTFSAYNTDIKVVGIYDTGTQFANNGVIMPLSTLQRLSNQTNDVTAATVTVNSIDNLDTAATAIKNKLGSAADVTSSQQTAENAIAPLENVKTIALSSLVATLIAGALIVLLTMVMIVRERRREIGVMKAIGSSNGTIMGQFIVESIMLTVIGLVIGFGITLAAAAPITNALVDSNTTSSQQRPSAGGQGEGEVRRGGSRMNNLQTITGQSVRSVQASVGPDILAYGVGTAILIAIIGSAVPAYFISKVRPSEVMRAD